MGGITIRGEERKDHNCDGVREERWKERQSRKEKERETDQNSQQKKAAIKGRKKEKESDSETGEQIKKINILNETNGEQNWGKLREEKYQRKRNECKDKG